MCVKPLPASQKAKERVGGECGPIFKESNWTGERRTFTQARACVPPSNGEEGGEGGVGWQEGDPWEVGQGVRDFGRRRSFSEC